MSVTNYDKQVIAAREHFLKWDQKIMIERFHLTNDADYLYVQFFGNKYSIDRKTAEVINLCDNSPAGFNEVLSIYDYLCDIKYDAYISGEWQSLHNLSPHSNFGSKESGFNSKLEELLRGKSGELKAACEKLGGQSVTKADVGFLFYAFDSFPIIFQFWDGDDEFAPRINFLFDKNALDYIRFETAYYVAGHLLEMIERQMTEH